MRTQNSHILCSLIIAAALLGFAREVRADVLHIRVDDEITPASAEVIASAIKRAEYENATALIITLSTPGGLDTSMRDIVSAIDSTSVPVVIYVAPRGARAASAGFIIMMAADVAAMAPGTVTGAAHPVMADGRDLGKTMSEKVVNDVSAYVRSHAEKHGRDQAAAESAVRESRSFTEQEALEKHVIEIVARDLPDLVAQLEGRPISRMDGSKLALHVDGQTLREITPTLRQRLLMALADPRIAFVLFAIGALCVYFEFQHPGAVLPGVAGTLAVVLALYGFHMLPINVTGVVLILVAIALFVLEAKVGSFGILGIGGIVAAVIGSLILIDVPVPELRLPPELVLAVVVPFGVMFTLMLRLAIKARRAKVLTGIAGMIGLIGKAQTAISPDGTVFVHGELWKARSKKTIPRGEAVRVLSVEGLTLEVETLGNDSPRETSAIQ
ncbi:MAG TPA: nodulation protein NfeD [Blastocatellia bacterium]|nr:nodulation protein NfeD [Blastocatellia bacterium]